MPYGQSDDLIDEQKAHREAVALLMQVATGEKNKKDVQKWLEKEHPDLCEKKLGSRKKW